MVSNTLVHTSTHINTHAYIQTSIIYNTTNAHRPHPSTCRLEVAHPPTRHTINITTAYMHTDISPVFSIPSNVLATRVSVLGATATDVSLSAVRFTVRAP
jgi:hypothetical protein